MDGAVLAHDPLLALDVQNSMKALTLKRLKALMRYNPKTGLFRRVVPTVPGTKAGEVAGCLDGAGYWRVRVDNVTYLAHRLAWFYMNGRWPRYTVDHVNGKRSDNRYSNLRDVTISVNLQNQRLYTRANATGYLGVVLAHKKYEARITVDGERLCLGRFKTPRLAHAAYVEAKRRLHKGCTI